MHPVLLALPFGLRVYAYGTMLCLSVLVGRYVALRLAVRAGLDPKLMDRCCLWTMAAALAGARLAFVATNPEAFDSVLDVLRWWKGGLVAYGGFIGGFAGSLAFCRAQGIPFLEWADCATPSLGIGLMVTRIGCFLGGCDFGRPWNGPLAVSFPAGSPAFLEQTLLGLLPAGAARSLSVHPTQLYESLVGLVLLIVVMAARRRRRTAGEPFAVFVLGYAVLRYLVEILRADSQRGFVGPFSTSQFLAMITFVAAAALLFALRHGRSQPASA